MTVIQTNKPVFFGNNGEVLKSGYIYIGQPNQDPVPVANRKTVKFKDIGGTEFTASQPLRTGVDGRIVYEATGKPIIAKVDGNYSMLVQDENGVQIKNGYTPLIENASSTGVGSEVFYRATLVDLKAYNGTPGDYVENIGKATTTDGDGARWLVISNTGSSGDDIDLIDFDNGTQGQRVLNQLYSNKNLSDLDNAATSRTNLDVYSKGETVKTLSVFVDSTGSPFNEIKTTGTSLAVSSISKPGTGIYLVQFNSNINDEALYHIQVTANVRLASYSISSADTIQVSVFTTSAVAEDRDFFLQLVYK